MKQVGFRRVLQEYVDYSLQQILFYQVYDESFIFCLDNCFVEFNNPKIKEFWVEPLQTSNLFYCFLLYCKNSESKSMFLSTFSH